MPNVPQVAGVPPLSSYGPNSAALLFADAVSLISSLFGLSQWGIFLDGVQAFAYNSVIDFDYKNDMPVSDYQVEDGGFQDYDKVNQPFDVKVRVGSGGTELERQDLIQSVLAAANTLDLYDVVTPEATFFGCNITHVDFKRAAHSGVGLVVVDVWFTEIRVTSTSTFSNTASPVAAGQKNSGSVSAQPVPGSVSQGFDNGSFQVQ
jgi:hypothetical protein